MNRIFTLYFLLLFGLTLNAQTITWQKQTGPYGGSVKKLVVHPTNFTVYALAGSNNNNLGKLYRSSDNGSTWVEQTPVAFSSDIGQIRDIHVLLDGTLFALGYNNLYKSTNDGLTWTKINTGTSSSSNGFDQGEAVAVNSFYGTGTVYVTGYDYSNSKYTLFRSTNGGATFTKGYTNASNYSVTNIAITGNGDVYGIIGGALMRSADDGVSFTAVTLPVDANNVATLTSTLDGSLLAMVTYSTNMYTLASTIASPSTTWSAALTKVGIADPVTFASGSVLLRFSLDKTTMFLMDNQNNKFYSRTSGNWTSQNTTFVTSNGEDATCFASKDNTILFVGTNDIGIWKSSNAGSGWIESDTGIESSFFNSIVVADDGSITVAGERTYRSTDNGASWSRLSNVINPGYYAFKATTGSPKPIVLLGQNSQTSYRSTNSGSSWSPITATPSNAGSFISSDGTKIVGLSNNQIFYTSDQGTTWSAALTISGTGWPSGTSFYFQQTAIDQNADIYTYLFDYNAPGPSSYKFFKIHLTSATTGTATQISLSTIGVTNVNGVGYSNNTVYVIGYGNSGNVMSSTTNSGTTWTPNSSVPGGGYRIDNDPLNNYLFVTDNNGSSYTIKLSRDGGSTFTSSSVNVSSNNSSVYGYALNSSGVAFVGFSNSSIYKTSGTIVLPAAPTSLVNSGAGSDRVTLRWIDNATNEDRFVIEKFNGTSYDSIGYKYSNSTTGAKVYYEVKNLQANTSYQFRVSAKNTAGNSAYVTIPLSTINQCATTIPDNKSWNGTVSASGTPSSSSLTNISIKSLGNGYFSITDVANGTIASEGTIIPAKFLESCGSTYLVPNSPTQPNTDGSWNGTTLVLKWITGNGVSPEITGTTTLTVNGSDPIPAAPSNATAYIYNNTSIEVSWVGSAFETQYIVERSSVDNTFLSIDKTYTVNYPATSVIDNFSLSVGVTYYYRVKAKNSAGTSAAASNTASVQFKLPYFVLSGTTVESTTAYSGTGAIWGDFNNDGFDDLVIPQLTFFSGTPALPLAFKNDGAGNFLPITPTGIVSALYIVGTAGDYDNDGKLDLFLTTDNNQNYLYKGNGDFTFSPVSSAPLSQNYNIGASQIIDLGASWADYNNDGLLDLFVATNDNTRNSKLFTQSPAGTLTLATSGGLEAVAVQGSVALWADYDNDGDQDVFINDGNNSAANSLYKNNGDGTFTRVSGTVFDTDLDKRTFTGAWGDYNNDGYLDLFIGARTNNILYKNNNGNGTFTKQSFPTSVTENLTNSNDQTFGSAWGDINNDGYQDLLVTVPGEESRIYLNTNGTGFTKVSTEKFNDIKVGRFGMAFSDYNKDGFLDLASAVIDPGFFGGGFVSGPSVKNQIFKNNTASSSNTNWVELKVTGTTSNKMGIGTRITLVAGGKTQIREIASTTSFCAQASQVVHFGIGSSSSITSIQIKWPSGITQTLTSPSINQILQIIEDGTPPAVTVLNPANNAVNVAINTSIEITFSKPFVAVAGKKINVLIQGSSPPDFSLNVTTGTIVGNKISFTLPASLGYYDTYDVNVDAGAFQDIYGNATPAINWSFVTIDNVSPVITFTPPVTLDKNFSSTPFAVTIDDNSGTVTTATLSYRKIAGGTFTDVAGSFNAGTSLWNFTVQESFFDGNGMEFYLTAKDPSNNVGRLPLDPTTNFYTYLNYKLGDNIVPSTQIGFGGTANSWKIFTIPYDLGSGNAITTVLSQLSSLTIQVDWRMLTYKNNTAWGEYPADFSTFTRGQGYFINIKNPLSLSIPAASAAQNNRKNLFQMTLKKGWNQVGNPYLTAISWDDVKNFTGNIGLTGTGQVLKKFASGSYANQQSLQPFEGGFVLAENDVTVSIPFAGQTTPGGRQSAPVVFEEGDWIVPLVLSNGEIENEFGGVGMHSAAKQSYDQFDDINAPRFFDYLEMNFAHPEHIAKEFARDVVPQTNEYTWEFTVESNMKGMTELKWGSISGVSKDIYLYDIGRESIVNMKENSSYTFEAKKSSTFRVYYGDNLDSKIKPHTVSLGDAYPNPSGNSKVTIPFTLPESPSSYQVALEVYNSMGQKVSTLVNGSYASGFYNSQWEPSQELNSGLYIYRMKVVNKDNASVISKKIILNH